LLKTKGALDSCGFFEAFEAYADRIPDRDRIGILTEDSMQALGAWPTAAGRTFVFSPSEAAGDV